MSKRELHNVTDMLDNFLERGDPSDYGEGDVWDEVIYTDKRTWFRYDKIWCSEGKPSEEEEKRFIKAIQTQERYK